MQPLAPRSPEFPPTGSPGLPGSPASPPPPPRRSWRVRALLVAAVGAVLAATLPGGHADEAPDWTACIVCGERGVADALANVILFLPVGAGCALQAWPLRRSVLAGALLAAAVELVQVLTPGRDPSLGDILFNTTGAWTGFLLARAAPSWLSLAPRRAARWSLAASIPMGAVLWLTGALLRPAFPDAVYYGQWRPKLGYPERYRGRVLRAELGSMLLPPRALQPSGDVRRLLLADSGVTLRIRVIAGTPMPALAPMVSIADERRREILLLGADRGDLVLFYRTWATALRLDQPDLRFVAALGPVAPGDTIEARARRDRGGYCLAINDAERCGLGFSAGSGWALLMYPEVLPAWLKTLLNALWLAGLCFPIGVWARRRWETVVATGLATAALIAIPPAAGLAPAAATEWAGVFGGLALGAVAHVAGVATRRQQNPPH